jgi:death-on-curing protein
VALQNWRFLSEQEIVRLHELVIGRFGGMPGVRDAGALSSCVAQPKTAVFGEERFPRVFDKAAAYCYFIVRLHPFFDGNKRTGLVAAITFLLDHGIAPVFNENEMYDVMIRVANGQIELDALADVLRRTGRQPL